MRKGHDEQPDLTSLAGERRAATARRRASASSALAEAHAVVAEPEGDLAALDWSERPRSRGRRRLGQGRSTVRLRVDRSERNPAVLMASAAASSWGGLRRDAGRGSSRAHAMTARTTPEHESPSGLCAGVRCGPVWETRGV